MSGEIHKPSRSEQKIINAMSPDEVKGSLSRERFLYGHYHNLELAAEFFRGRVEDELIDFERDFAARFPSDEHGIKSEIPPELAKDMEEAKKIASEACQKIVEMRRSWENRNKS